MTIIIILLGILKIVLYTLLTLLVLALILLAIVLFWEFKYFFVCNISNNVSFNAQVTWILKIFRLKIFYNNFYNKIDNNIDNNIEGFTTDLRVLWFKLMEKHSTEGASTGEKRNESQPPESTNNESKYESAKPKGQNKRDESGGQDEPNKLEPDDNNKSGEPDGRNKRLSKSGRKKSGGIFKKIKETADKVSYIKNYPDREIITKSAIKMLTRFKKAFKKCDLKVYGEFGFDDPSLTGTILGLAYAASGLIGLDSALKGDFEHKTIDLKIESQGKIKLWSFVWPLTVFVFSKPVWEIIQKFFFRKEDE